MMPRSTTWSRGSTMRATTPVVQAFDYLAFTEDGPSGLQQVAPGHHHLRRGRRLRRDRTVRPGRAARRTSRRSIYNWASATRRRAAAKPPDFAGFTAGNIALLQRGFCTVEIKAENAAEAGAVGIVILNQGNTTAVDREQDIPPVTLTANNTSGIPVIGTTYALGVTLSETPGLRHADLRQHPTARS